MTVLTSCSWCHGLNPVDQEACSSCGHLAQVARMEEPRAQLQRDRALERARQLAGRDA